ncbi:hypothetical protein LOK49_LG09G00328 [Camellia lanceoleosa]|uniref:Uncharacterized protein n=1 Tax=Camellia lanceoleosa TaxID=1840588 RepID=A0ACC0GHB4_9ERIC|nr:hypothetical protein LOK49_LG09G00328 [Camellia lanceoleosa]
MASEAPSWADQWGAGGIGAMEDEDDNTKTNKAKGGNKKTTMASAVLGKAKAVAKAGAQNVKSGTSMAISWIKNKCQKKNKNANEWII